MAAILRDPRVGQVSWRDLTCLTRAEVVRELLLSLPWILASLALVELGIWPLALLASFVFFLCGLRQVHGAFHHAVGLTRAGDDAVLFVLSVAMLGSMHAVRFNHLRHHRFCMAEEDVEAESAQLPGWKAIALGPRFPVRLHRSAWRHGGAALRRWMVAELLAGAALIGVAFGLLDWTPLRYHLAAMAFGQCLTAFFAVWTVHHDCDREHFIARTVRGSLRSALTYHMFFHVEHHLFPAVPTRRLPELACRLDCAAPELSRYRVF